MIRHCEERSDVAVHAFESHGSPRFARDDKVEHGLAMTMACVVNFT